MICEQVTADAPTRLECCRCLELFSGSDLQPINPKESACPECLPEIMRDFRACDQ